MASGRAYGGVPAPARRAARRAALLGAGLDILGTDGHRRLTVGALCARAGLNERYFYESFASPDEIVVAVYDDVLAEVGAAIVAAVAAAAPDTAAKARAAITAAVQVLTGDPRKTRVVFVEPLYAPPLAGRRSDVARTFVALIVGQAHDFYGPETSLRVGSWAEFSAAHLLGGFAETMTAWLRGDLAISEEEFIERSTELFVLVADFVVGR